MALVQLLLGLLADVVFASATKAHKGFEAEMSQYLSEHRFSKTSSTRPPAR